jgi:hypothetical protein
LVASGYSDFWDNFLTNAIYKEQDDTFVVLGRDVWTGTLADGGVLPDFVLGATTTPLFGNSWDSSSFWAFIGVDSDSANERPMYALSSPITVVPIPAAVWLFGSALIGLIGVARRKARA